MRPRRFAAPQESTSVFDHAVGESALAVVTLQEGNEWRSFKSRFLERDPQARFFVLDYQSIDDEPLPVLTPGQFTGISFRHKSRKILFATVVEATGKFAIDGGEPVSAVRYRWPESFTELQRRSYYRTPVPDTMRLTAHLWPGGVAARKSAQAGGFQFLTGSLIDMSCGGCLISMNQTAAPDWPENSTLGCELALPDGRPPMCVDTRYRGARHDTNGTLCIALQFIGLEMALDGQLTLQRLSRCVQKLSRTAESAGYRGGSPDR